MVQSRNWQTEVARWALARGHAQEPGASAIPGRHPWSGVSRPASDSNGFSYTRAASGLDKNAPG